MLRFRAMVKRLWTRRYEYTVDMRAEPGREGWKLQGRKDFGRLAGGVFHYRGEIKGNVFECLYSAEEDRGVFHLARYTSDVSSSP